MHDWVIKHIVTAAHLIFSIHLSCVMVGYFTVNITPQVPHLHTVAPAHNHHSMALAKGVAFCWRTEVYLN